MKRHSSPYTLPVLLVLAGVLFARTMGTGAEAPAPAEAAQLAKGQAMSKPVALTWAQSSR